MTLNRRRILSAAGSLAVAGCAPFVPAAPPIGRVVVIGGGFGGATVARYLRRWLLLAQHRQHRLDALLYR